MYFRFIRVSDRLLHTGTPLSDLQYNRTWRVSNRTESLGVSYFMELLFTAILVHFVPDSPLRLDSIPVGRHIALEDENPVTATADDPSVLTNKFPGA